MLPVYIRADLTNLRQTGPSCMLHMCAGSPNLCAGTCVDILSNVNHCGA